MIKKIAQSITVTVALILATLAISATPASAAAPEGSPWIYVGVVSAEYNTPQANPTTQYLGQCNTNYLYCAWTGANFTGSFYAWNTAYNNTCVPTSGVMNDSITSFWNNMPSFKATMYIDGGCKNPSGWGGISPTFSPGTYTSDIRCYAAGCWQYDNAISSFRTHL